MVINVGYFVETPVAHNLTGGSRSFLELILRLKNDGVVPFVVVSEKWKLTDILKKNGIKFCVAKSFRPFVSVEKPVFLFRIRYLVNQFFNYFAYLKAKKFFKENKVEIIHINSQFAGIYGARVAKKLHTPYVYHIREFLDKGFGLRFFNEKKAFRAIDGANKIIAISTSIEKYRADIHSPGKVVKIYNGLNFSGLPKNEKKAGDKFLSPCVNMCIVGRVCEFKRQLDAIKATELLFKKYQIEAKLHIIGCECNDEYEKSLRRYVEDNGLCDMVNFVPFLNDPLSKIQDFDIGLICSEGEAFGRATIEYFASNLLVFGANSGATPELINNNEDGYLFELGDYEELALLIKESIENPEHSREMIARGYMKALSLYSLEKTAKEVLKLYNDILGRSQK